MFYNATYINFAAPILLIYMKQGCPEAETPELLLLVGRAVEILEVMDECTVALKMAKVSDDGIHNDDARLQSASGHGDGADEPLPGTPGLFDGDMGLEFAFPLGNLDEVGSLSVPDEGFYI
ncbi:hypothetical protein PG994_013674 [Apiospora phragmitis]|uniref:Uncharacterized protein n=1 Tax=Apiospora phragmitis TaxID=2905665 RepID=A0ABR1TB32_9PEZI